MTDLTNAELYDLLREADVNAVIPDLDDPELREDIATDRWYVQIARAAYAAGRASVLDDARDEWRVGPYTDGHWGTYDNERQARRWIEACNMTGFHPRLEHRRVMRRPATEWVAVDGGQTEADDG